MPLKTSKRFFIRKMFYVGAVIYLKIYLHKTEKREAKNTNHID